MLLTADFHNHSCLSPCGSLELSPTVLIDEAMRKGVQLLALTDHNSARNAPAFETLCKASGLFALPGLEVTTQEELHCLCLFRSAADAVAFGAFVEDHLLKIANKPEKWGDQIVVDADENVLDEVPYWLGTSTDIPLTALGEYCLAAGGLFVPAHIDRPSQSVLSQLGYLPDLPYSALEIRRDAGGLDTRGKTLVMGSDAHYPDDVGSRTCLVELEETNFEGLSRALLAGAVRFEGPYAE